MDQGATAAVSVNESFSIERAEWREGGFLTGSKLDLARDLVHGFSRDPKCISSRYFFDAEGARLFSQILELPEYYLCSRETAILSRSAAKITSLLGKRPVSFIELAPRDIQKTSILMNALSASGSEFVYRPVDVSRLTLDAVCANVRAKRPGLRVQTVCDETERAMTSIGGRRGAERVFLSYLGSAIGNRSRNEVAPFLSQIRSNLREGDLVLIGFDLVKDVARMTRAYSDSEGVTRAFNLNLLMRMNRELGADFSCSQFTHEAVWNPRERAMESWLFSKREQAVRIDSIGRSFQLKKWEGIHTETSLKFEVGELDLLALRSGFEPVEKLEDRYGDFCEVIWRVGASAPTQSH